MSSTLSIPTVTQEDLDVFHYKHFPDSSNYRLDSSAPEAVEDDLYYYPDGVKRTLTDEQILMFRHSEEETERRAERHKKQKEADEKEEEEEEMEIEIVKPEEGLSIARQDKSSGKTFLWPSISKT